MQHIKKHWRKLPDNIRRLLVLVVGLLLILTSALIGWIPGPGGSVIFLLGIAVLASEFTWAERIKNYLFNLYKQSVAFIRSRPILSLLGTVLGAIVASVCLYIIYKYYI